MEVSDAPSSLEHFLAGVCAVVGEGFAVTGMMDRWIHRVVELVGKKAAATRAVAKREARA